MNDQKEIFYSSKQSKLFAQSGIEFFVTSRFNGFSSFPYDSLNLGYHTGDNAECVKSNREKIAQIFPDKQLLWLDQIHSNKILNVSNQYPPQGLLGEADGFLCFHKDLACVVMVADCNPVLIYEKNINIFALLHAGREGLRAKIITKALEKILKIPNASVENILVFVGPSIRKCCYEIGKDLALTFDKAYIQQDNEKYKLDLISLLIDELTTHQIPRSSIEISPVCTCCEKDLFSYRREVTTGRFGLVATLKI